MTSQPQATIVRRFTFEAAHRLPRVPEGHKCARLHGHSYQIELQVHGPIGAESGWVMDFANLKAAWRPLHERLDHRCLNDIPELENPTSERLAVWLWDHLAPALPGLRQVVVIETERAHVIYQGPSPIDGGARG